MSASIGNYFRAIVWALVGSLLLGVFFYPLGGAGGLVGLNFMVYNLIADRTGAVFQTLPRLPRV